MVIAALLRISAAVFWLVTAVTPVLAGDRLLNLEGRFVQGGLAFGSTEAGARVFIDSVAVRVHDSNADMRYLVLPARPDGTDGWSEEQLGELVTRDCMVGVSLPKSPGA